MKGAIMTKKMLQGIATGIFFTTSIFGFNFYFTDNSQIETEVASFSEQDLQAYLQENDLVAVSKAEYVELFTKDENNEVDEKIVEEDVEAKEITIIIKPGMSSGEVGLLLQEKGLIDDYQQFSDYIMNNQLETKVKAGEFKLSTEMTIKEIVEALS